MSVCKTFFLATLGISERTFFTTLSKVTPDGHVTQECRHVPEPRKIPEQKRKEVREHISCFPTVESHYCRHEPSREYHVAGNVMSVCKTFFLATLGISERTVFTTLSKVTPDGHVTPECRHVPESRRIPEQKRKEVREHISCFPTVESHYCRHESSREYLPQQLTKAEMY